MNILDTEYKQEEGELKTERQNITDKSACSLFFFSFLSLDTQTFLNIERRQTHYEGCYNLPTRLSEVVVLRERWKRVMEG